MHATGRAGAGQGDADQNHGHSHDKTEKAVEGKGQCKGRAGHARTLSGATPDTGRAGQGHARNGRAGQGHGRQGNDLHTQGKGMP